MASLYFKVGADYDKVIRLREEIEKLKSELSGMDGNTSPATLRAMETQLAKNVKEMDSLIASAAKAGNEIEQNFKKKIFDASQSVNGFTEKIIAQKAVVKDVEADVKRLGEAYRTALKRNSMSASGKLADYTSAKKALDEEKAALFGLTQEQANARLSVKKLRDEYSLYNKEAGNTVQANEKMSLSLGKVLRVIGGVAALKKLGSEIIRVRGEFQSMQTAIETMVGKDIARQIMPQIKELAKISPLTMTDMVGAEKMMLGFNIQAEDTIKYLKALSDLSMGESGKFNSLTLAFSQMSAAGKLMGQDLNQMINAGFNPLQSIAEKTGKSITQLKDEMFKGAVSAEMVQQAFIDATSAGGKFFGMSENASKTINGQISMMQDALDDAFNEIGQKSEGIITSGIQATTSLIQNYETVGKVLVGLIATYGTYRTALMLSTIATSKHTITEVALTNVRVLARRAQMALNAAMLTNPYVLLATAVVGLGVAMWAFHDSSTEAEKAQKRFNERQEEASKQEQEHKQKIDELVNSSRDIALADLQRGESLAKLRKEYPKIFEKYDIETIKLADILELKKQIADEDAKRLGEKKAKEFSDVESEIKFYENLLLSLAGKQGTDGYAKKLQELRAYRDEILKDKGKNISEQFISTLKDVDISDFDRYISELEKKIKGKRENGKVKMKLPIDVKGTLSDEAIYDVKDIKTLIGAVKTAKKAKDDAAKEEKKSASEWLSSYKKAYKDAEKAYNDFLISKEVMSDSDRDKELKRLKELRDTAKTTYERKGGSVSSNTKQEKQTNKLVSEQADRLKAIEDYRKSISDAEVQAEFDIRQVKIDAMDEGSAKELAQINLNYDKLRDVNRKRANDMIKEQQELERKQWEYDNPKWKEKGMTFKPITISAQQLSQLQQKRLVSFDSFADISRQKATKEYLDKEKQAMDEYLKEYGSFMEKKQAITDLYNEQISKATTPGEKLSLKKQLDEELKSLNLSEFKKGINFAEVFGNLDNLTTDSITRLRDKLKDYINKAASGLKPEDLKDLSDALANIEIKAAEKNPFGEIGKSLDDYKQATEGVEQAQDKLNYVMSGGEIVIGLYEDSTGKLCKKLLTQEQVENDLVKAQNKRAESIARLNTTLAAGVGKAQDYMDVAKAMVGALEDFGVEVPEQLTGFIDGMGNAFDSLESINLTNPVSILKGAIGVIGGLGKAIGSLFNNDSKKEKNIERLQEQVDVLDKSYEKLSQSIENAYSTDASNLIDQQNKMLEQQKVLIEQQIAEEESKKHTDDDRIKEWREQLDEINNTIEDNKVKAQDAIFGSDVKSAIDDFANAYVDAWGAGEDRAKSMKDTVKKMIKGVIVEMMKADLAPTVQALRDKIESALSDGIISDYEQSELDRLIEQATSGMDSKYSWTDKYLNGDDPDSTSTREATAKGIASISQDSANAIDGKMSSQLIFLDKTLVEVTGIREQMSFIRELQIRGWEDVRAIRELSSKVSDNTNRIADLSEKIVDVSDKIEVNTSKAARTVQDIKDSGLILKKQ